MQGDDSKYDKNGKMAARFYRALESVSIAYQLPLWYHLPTPDPSPSTLTVLNSNFLQLGRRRLVAGHRGQFTPGGYLSLWYTLR